MVDRSLPCGLGWGSLPDRCRFSDLCFFFELCPNLKKLVLNLPELQQTLTNEIEEKVLRLKASAPKNVTVEFCGATPKIAEELTAAWSKYVPDWEDQYQRCVCQTLAALIYAPIY